MKITIDNEEYNIEVNGTVGLMYMVRRMLGEDFNHENNDHVIALYYVVFATSNQDKDVKMEWFLSHLTYNLMKVIGDEIERRWSELEGVPLANAKKKKAKG